MPEIIMFCVQPLTFVVLREIVVRKLRERVRTARKEYEKKARETGKSKREERK